MKQLWGHRFNSEQDVIAATKDTLRTIQQEQLHKHFQQLSKEWQMCVMDHEHYFESGCV
jgi:hypothetical protein